jgi:hypothetical protein
MKKKSTETSINPQKGKKALEDLGVKVKDGAQTAFNNLGETIGNVLNRDSTTAAPAASPAA